MEDLKEKAAEALIKLLKYWPYAAVILLTAVARFSYNKTVGKKMTFWESLWSLLLTITVGMLVAIVVVHEGFEKRGYLMVIFATLLSDKLFTWFFANWKEILMRLFRVKERDDA